MIVDTPQLQDLFLSLGYTKEEYLKENEKKLINDIKGV